MANKKQKFNPLIALHLLAAANLKQQAIEKGQELDLVPDTKASDALAKTFAKDFGLSYQRGKGGLLPAENSLTKDLDRAIMALLSGMHKSEELAEVANWEFPDNETITKLTVLAENALNLGYFLPENNGRVRDIAPSAETESLSGSLVSQGEGGVHITVPQPEGNINSNTDGKTGGIGLPAETEGDIDLESRIEYLELQEFYPNEEKTGYVDKDGAFVSNELLHDKEADFYKIVEDIIVTTERPGDPDEDNLDNIKDDGDAK